MHLLRKRVGSIFLLILLTHFSYAQKFTISGYVTDRETGESLVGANIINRSGQGTTTNKSGFYSITLSRDSVTLTCSYVGYKREHIIFLHARDTSINVAMSVSLLEEILVPGTRIDPNTSFRSGTFSLPVTDVKTLPAFAGEPDIMRTLQLLPGVQSHEGSSGIYVRGGGPDQNLVLLDGIPIYNASHLYGFYSTLNTDAINHVEVMKGGFPARYGGRLSSVVDVTTKEGDQKQIQAMASIGLISARFLVEGPIQKDRSSFMVSGRRTFLNLMQSGIFREQDKSIADNYRFYDINATINQRLGRFNRLHFSFYNGHDKSNGSGSDTFADSLNIVSTTNNTQSELAWGNTIATMRWNAQLTRKLFSNLTLAYNHYKFGIGYDYNSETTVNPPGDVTSISYTYRFLSGVRDYVARYDVDYSLNPANHLRAGVSYTDHLFSPGVIAVQSNFENSERNAGTQDVRAQEGAVYVEDDLELSAKLTANIGVHAALFAVGNQTYTSVQPRASVVYKWSDRWAGKISYAKTQQFMHLLANAGIGLPTDLWVPATSRVKPQLAHQLTAGVSSTRDLFEFSVETWYKKLSNVIEYKDGATYLSRETDWQDKVECGRGESFGAEFFVERKWTRLTGWIGYTISKTQRQFDHINNGQWFPYRYDRRHDAKLVVMYRSANRFSYSLSWVYGTGNAVSLPLDRYAVNWVELFSKGGSSTQFYHEVENYTERNNYRMKSYHRLDVSASYTIVRKRTHHLFNISIYNFYARRNPFYLEFGFDHQTNRRVLYQVSLLPIVPSLNYTITLAR